MNNDDLRRLVSRLQVDPIYHIEKIQGVTTLEKYQKRVIKTIAENQFTAVAACHDVGKTWTLAKIVLWFASTFKGSKVITTAPTWLQIEMLLWSEIRSGYAKSKVPLGGRMLNTEWKIDDDWFALGMSSREDADNSGGGQGTTSGFQGFHAPYILIVFDEATGVPPKRWLQAHGMLTSANVKMVAVGNPTTKNSDFYQCFQSRLWAKVHLSCFDSPNLQINGVNTIADLQREIELLRTMTDPEVGARIRAYKIAQPSLLTLQWVVDRGMSWGLDHPLFASKVLGQFPDEDANALFTLSTIEEAQRRVQTPSTSARCGIGVDVARYGIDKSVITTIRGNQVYPAKQLMKRDTDEVTGHVVLALNAALAMGQNPGLTTIAVDATGIGSGVVDNLNRVQRLGGIPKSVEIKEVHFGQGFDDVEDDEERDDDRKNYFNLKAKIFVQLSEDMKTVLCMPPDESVYLEELPTIAYRIDSKGKYVIESKDEYKARTGLPSPDHSDSLAIANYARKNVTAEVGVMRMVPSR